MSNLFAGSLVAGICAGLFALALGAIGVVLIVQYMRNKQKAQASQTWPSTPGKIIGHRIRVDETEDADGDSRVRYVPEVHFEYQVDGIVYQGKRISFGSEPDFGLRPKAQAFLESYPVESETTAYYNPDNPQEAVLSQTMRKMTAHLIVGIVLLVMMICFLCPVVIGLFNTVFS
jgi:hypothetical protein